MTTHPASYGNQMTASSPIPSSWWENQPGKSVGGGVTAASPGPSSGTNMNAGYYSSNAPPVYYGQTNAMQGNPSVAHNLPVSSSSSSAVYQANRAGNVGAYSGAVAPSASAALAGSNNPSTTGLIRLTLRKPMGIVFEPMTTPNGVQRGVRICDLPRTGAAALSGRLQVGDELLSINDVTMSRMTFDEILDFIIEANAERVELLFRRPKKDDKISSKASAKDHTRGIKWADEEEDDDTQTHRSKSVTGGNSSSRRHKENSRSSRSDRSTGSSHNYRDKDRGSRRRRRRSADDDTTEDGRYAKESFLDMLIDSICFAAVPNKKGDDYYDDDESYYTYDGYDDETATIDSAYSKDSYSLPSRKNSSSRDREKSSSKVHSAPVSRQKLTPVVEEENTNNNDYNDDLEYDTRSDPEETMLDETNMATDEPSVNGSVLTMPTLDGTATGMGSLSHPTFASYSPLIRDLAKKYNFKGYASEDIYQFIVTEMLAQHEPEKVRLVDKLLAKYQNREEYLIRKLAGRYKVSNTIEEEPEQERDTSENVENHHDHYDMNDNESEVDKELHQESQKEEEEEEEESKIDLQSNSVTNPDYDEYGVDYESVEDNDDVNEFQTQESKSGNKVNHQTMDEDVESDHSDFVDQDRKSRENINFKNDDVDSEQYYDDGDEQSEGTEELDTASPALIAQVSELLNFVYGKVSVPAQIDRVSTIMRAYEGRETVLLELLETKALIKANSVKAAEAEEARNKSNHPEDFNPPDDISSVSGNSEHHMNQYRNVNAPPPPPRGEEKQNFEDEMVSNNDDFADFSNIPGTNAYSNENMNPPRAPAAASQVVPSNNPTKALKANYQTASGKKKKNGFFGLFKGGKSNDKEKSKKKGARF